MAVAGQNTLLKKVRYYRTKANKIKKCLIKFPLDWGKYQAEFNHEVDSLFSQIMEFEKNAFKKNDFTRMDRLKNIFIQNFRKEFYYGEYSKWTIDKPYGYAGDFKIIDDIYKNNPSTDGYARLFDNYFQTSAISIAVRNRKEDFKRMINQLIKKNSYSCIQIMNLASGPSRDVKEILEENLEREGDINFDCYDIEKEALKYASDLIGNKKNVTFYLESALRIAGAKNINSRIEKKYDLIYSMGLFDYLNYKISARLVSNLKKLLKPNGALIVADVRERYLNPSVFYMEWAGDWNLIYRTDEEFKQIFLDVGFKDKQIEFQYEQQGIMQYIIARNN